MVSPERAPMAPITDPVRQRLVLAFLLLPCIAIVAVIGFGVTLPSEHRFTRAVELTRPCAEVYEVLDDVADLASWSSRVLAVEPLPALGPNVYRQRFGDRRSARLQIESRTRDHAVVWSLADEAGPFRGRWRHTLAPTEAAGCRITLTEEARIGNAVSRVLSYFAAGTTRFAEDHLRDLTAHLGASAIVERVGEDTTP